MLLEHLAAAARERGITRFVAETLFDNRAMLSVFRDAGFDEKTRPVEGVNMVELMIEPSDRTLAVIEQREHRAESLSVARLLTPGSVAVIGASRDPSSIGHHALRNLLAGGFSLIGGSNCANCASLTPRARWSPRCTSKRCGSRAKGAPSS